MSTPKPCPPLALDEELATMIERYRAAKRTAAAAMKKVTEVEKVGHYDKDTPLQPRNVSEVEATTSERTAAVALADHLLKWVDASAAR